MNRRDAISRAGAAMALGVTVDFAPLERAAQINAGRLRQSVCQWCYDKIPLDELCVAAKRIGLQSVELLGEKDWATVKRHGLTCAMANGPSTIRVGFNRPSEHDRLVAESERLLPLVAAAELPNMIVFSGNRDGMSDGEGLENCVKGLQRITPTAERLGVTVCMELLNSKVDHKDYMCDRTPWGAELVKRVASPRFKLLYDIYHMQIMEGDVIRTIRENAAHIGHFHTAGVPGRNEIDETQELQYPAIMRAIADLNYTGFVGQEFIPKRDPLTSLAQGVKICEV
ncbi:MAG: TIM barrel protein [Gemmatimonadaceae bacterium]|nr:TIM barrel protein [Gemmatimonadaceae bacterium]